MNEAIREYLNGEKYQPELYDDDGWKLLDAARAELDRIDSAIAAAVQAERIRCAETALDCFFDLTGTSTMSAPDVIKRTRYGIAAAIRARNGSR